MATTTYGVSLIFGEDAPLPIVPEGWRFIERPEDFLLIESPEGKRYFCAHEDGKLRLTLATPNTNPERKKWECDHIYDEREQFNLCEWKEDV